MAKTVIGEITEKVAVNVDGKAFIAELEGVFADTFGLDVSKAKDEKELQEMIAKHNKEITEQAYADAENKNESFDADVVLDEMKREVIPAAELKHPWLNEADRKKCPRISFEEYKVLFESFKQKFDERGGYAEDDEEMGLLMLKMYIGIMIPIVRKCARNTPFDPYCNHMHDAYQEGSIKLMEVLRKGSYFTPKTGFVRDPKMFLGWVKKVFWRHFFSISTRKNINKLEEATTPFSHLQQRNDDDDEIDIDFILKKYADEVDFDDVFYRAQTVRRAFNIVAASNMKMHTKLTFFYITQYFCEAGSQSNHIDHYLAKFSEMTLDGIYKEVVVDMLNGPSSALSIHPAFCKNMKEQLNKYNDDGVRIGDTYLKSYSDKSNIKAAIAGTLDNVRKALSKSVNRKAILGR